jgi:hypothetical protein
MEELDSRKTGSVEIALLWNRRTNRLAVTVRDDSTGHELRLSASPENALDVFNHPYAYADRSAA